MSRFSFRASDPEGLREEIKMWIKDKYSHLLGNKIKLLDHPEGFELLDKIVKERLFQLKRK